MRSAPLRGFTLIEVMVVLVIVATLAAIAWPSYMDSVRKGWRSEARSALMRQMQEQERQFTLAGRYRHYEGDSADGGAGGKYAVASGSCEGRGNIDSCIRLTATLKPGFSDPQVGTLWIDSTGNKGCDGAEPGRCWQ